MINIPMQVIAYINDQIGKTKNANIVIAGCSCSGKTTLANELFERLNCNAIQVNIIHEDSYFKNLKDLPRSEQGVLADSIDAFHVEEFVEAATSLVYTDIVYIPDYDLSTNKRKSSYTKMEKSDINVNVFEGLHSIKLLNNKFECMKIFMNISLQTCLQRRIDRDKRDWNIPKRSVEMYWKTCIEPVSINEILPQKEMANFLFQEGMVL